MRTVFGSGKRRDAQTLVFFLVAWGTIMLLCGLAIDSGLLYLAKARMGRAVDGAALIAVGNFNLNPDPKINRDQVALLMRNFAAANFTSLQSIATTGGPSGGTSGTYISSNGTTGTSYTYNFNDGTQDPNGAYRRYVQVVLATGSGGGITSATCSARCPVQTYFIGYGYAFFGGSVVKTGSKIGGFSGPSSLVDLKVSSSAVATRNPRLIMVVIDRSASMLAAGGGAYGLPQAVVTFLDFFDTSSDYIGIVSFGSSARLEMPLTTNFIIAGTNELFNTYAIATNSTQTNGVPGVDTEQETSSGAGYDPNYATRGVRRLKFGGQTAADDGIRLALEQMMGNPGFNDPDVVKYLVLFTDGKWNSMRTLVGAPGYTNVVTCTNTASPVSPYVTASNNAAAIGMANGTFPGPWSYTSYAANANLVTVPTLSPMPDLTNALQGSRQEINFANIQTNHYNDVWQSVDSSGYEPLKSPTGSAIVGDSKTITADTWLTNSGGTNYFTHNLDVWLPPGSVDYLYHGGSISNSGAAVYVSNYNNPTNHISIYLASGDSNVLVVPGYVVDGMLYDGLDLTYPDNPTYGEGGYPRFRADNYDEPLMWPDDLTPLATSTDFVNYTNAPVSLMRDLLYRNYANLLTGYYVNRADEPLSTQTEPLDNTTPATYRPLYGLGAYYPAAGFYWPFDLVGIDFDPTYPLINATNDPDQSVPYRGYSRHAAYSINMLSNAASPEWYGELFYNSVSGGGTTVISGTGTASASQIMTAANWQAGAPGWMAPFISTAGIMTSEATHNTNITPHPSVWRPLTFNGSGFPVALSAVTPAGSATGGYVTDGSGNYYKNAMAWSGRPTHYYDFSQSKWIPVANNHIKNTQTLPLCYWKAREYAWHARALGVTIYTVGYGSLVSPDQQVLLAQIANSTNTTAGNPQTWNGSAITSYTAGPGTAITYNPGQPIGQQFYATNAADITTDFQAIGQAINAALTQ